jgi:cobalt-zinc-cadmium efflux system outer membrane protein
MGIYALAEGDRSATRGLWRRLTAAVLIGGTLLVQAGACMRLAAAADEGAQFSRAIDWTHLRAHTLANNPDLKAAEQRWRASQARPSQEGSLPDPMINTGYHNEGFDQFRQGSSDFSWLRFGAEQEVPFPGKLSLKETMAAREADREGALYRATALEVLTRLRVAYDEYFLAHRSLEIIGKNKALLEKLERAAEARYKVGEGLQQDVLRAQVEISILLGRLASLEQARQSAAGALNALLNRPPLGPLGAAAPIEKRPFTYTLEELEAAARERSPSLRAAEFGVARAESNLSLARRQYYPDFVLRADYFNKAALVPEWELGAGIRVPLYFWRKQSFGVQEAAAGVGEARATRQGAAQDVLARIRDFYAQAASADRLVDLYGTTVLHQAQLSLDSASAGYEVGKVDFITLLNSFTVLNDYELRYNEELTNFDKALAQLEGAAGLLPEALPGGLPQ